MIIEIFEEVCRGKEEAHLDPDAFDYVFIVMVCLSMEICL